MTILYKNLGSFTFALQPRKNIEQMVNWEGKIYGRQITCALQFISAGTEFVGQGRDDEGHQFSLSGQVAEW